MSEFVTIEYEDGTSLETTNPFKIATELRRMVGDVEEVRPTASGKLVVKIKSQAQTELLLQQDHFLGKRAVCSFPDRINSVEAVAFAPSLSEVPEEEMLLELKSQGVIGIKRLRSKPGKKNPEIRFRFRGKTFPPILRAGFENIKMRP